VEGFLSAAILNNRLQKYSLSFSIGWQTNSFCFSIGCHDNSFLNPIGLPRKHFLIYHWLARKHLLHHEKSTLFSIGWQGNSSSF
jgi:hypothetical protein